MWQGGPAKLPFIGWTNGTTFDENVGKLLVSFLRAGGTLTGT